MVDPTPPDYVYIIFDGEFTLMCQEDFEALIPTLVASEEVLMPRYQYVEFRNGRQGTMQTGQPEILSLPGGYDILTHGTVNDDVDYKGIGDKTPLRYYRRQRKGPLLSNYCHCWTL